LALFEYEILFSYFKEETFKKLGDKRMFEEGLKSDAASTETADASSSDPAPSTNGGKSVLNILLILLIDVKVNHAPCKV
jgi:hypothetical protein